MTTLSLANSAGQTVQVGNHTATTLGLTVNNLGAASALNLDPVGAKYTTLNVTTATADSTLNVTGAAVQALTVAGTNALNLTGSTFTALKTVVVSGAAGVTAAVAFDGASVTDVNASATSGKMSATLVSNQTTYEGGSGVDNIVLLGATTQSKAISLGAGDDSLTLVAGTTLPTATLDGGAGTDTLSMDAASAATASGNTLFAAKVIGFEHLTLTGGGTNVVDVAQLGNYNYVTDSNGAVNSALTLNNMASGGTLVLTSTTNAATDTVNVINAATGTTDVVNVVLTAAGQLAAHSVTAANVETLNITATDTTVAAKANASIDALTVVDAKATALTVTGNAHLSLTVTGDTALTTIDAHAMTGGITVTTAGTVAETVTGGASSNTLTAIAGTTADTLIGGAAHDVLIANAGLDTLTGGGGNNTFNVSTASVNVNTYATITDIHAGDTIQFANFTPASHASFSQAQISLAPTAVFQDYANAAVHTTAPTQGSMAWFQFGGNTYVVEHGAAGAESSFTNGTDLIVKLAGVVDLSHTSVNVAGTLLVA